MKSELRFYPGHLINRSSRLMVRWGEPRFQALGLATAQIPVLALLRDGSPRSQSELARLIRIEQPTMAQLLARMQRDGLIRRTPDPSDRRSSLISLTTKAIKKLEPAREVLLEGNRLATQGFSKQEIDTLCNLLLRVVRNLDPDAELFCPE